MAYLKVNNLEKKYNNISVLKNISFEVNKNEVLCIIGKSGSGKTTLLRCLNYLETADNGEVLLNDDIIFESKKFKKIKENEKRKYIVSPCPTLYFDFSHSHVPLKKVYNYNIAKSGFVNEKNVLGVEFESWAEWIDTFDAWEFSVYPRIFALSEVAWTEDKFKNYKDFYKRLDFFKMFMKSKNINYYILSLLSLPGLIFSNYFITYGYLIILYILKKYILNFINYLNEHKKILYTLIFLAYLIIIIYTYINTKSLYNLYHILMMLVINTLLIIIIEKDIKLYKLNKEYQDLKIYSKTSEKLITKYRTINHENKNHLIIIRNMLETKEKGIEKYINNLIEEEVKVTNKWINNLQYIPVPGIKNFVNYKLNKLDSLNATIEIYISKELERLNVSKINTNQIDKLYTIIGVLLDNIIDSISEQDEKLVSVNAYIEGNTTNIELANTYNNYIDISKINIPNYTTKGENHGIGLYLVNKIIKHNKIFELDTRIDNEFFVQHLKIHHPKNHIK